MELLILFSRIPTNDLFHMNIYIWSSSFSDFSITVAYEWCVVNQQQEIEEVRRDEALRLPEDIDYFAIDASLSAEVREKLDSNRPQTVRYWATARLRRNEIPSVSSQGAWGVRAVRERNNPQVLISFLTNSVALVCSWLIFSCFHMQIGAVSRIPGITPAAIVNLLRYVKTNHQKSETPKALPQTGRYLPGKMYSEKATSRRQISAEISEEEPEHAFVKTPL